MTNICLTNNKHTVKQAEEIIKKLYPYIWVNTITEQEIANMGICPVCGGDMQINNITEEV